MADLAVRCDVTELITDQCAHCRKLPDPLPRQLGRAFVAAFGGWCTDCDGHFEAGEKIQRDREHGTYVGPCCSGEASDG